MDTSIGAGSCCDECRLSWPVANFFESSKQPTDAVVCTRCCDPKLEGVRWMDHYKNMARRMERARRKEQKKRLKAQEISSASAASSSRYTNPQSSIQLHQKQILKSSTEAMNRASAHSLQLPTNASNSRPALSNLGIAPGMQESSDRAGRSSSQAGPSRSVHPNGNGSASSGINPADPPHLAPLGIRLLLEPDRTKIWLQTRYVPDPNSHLPQSTIYREYMSSITDGINSYVLPAHRQTAFNEFGAVVPHFPAPLRGAELMNTITTQYPQIYMSKGQHGYSCVGLKPRSRDKVQKEEAWMIRKLTAVRWAAFDPKKGADPTPVSGLSIRGYESVFRIHPTVPTPSHGPSIPPAQYTTPSGVIQAGQTAYPVETSLTPTIPSAVSIPLSSNSATGSQPVATSMTNEKDELDAEDEIDADPDLDGFFSFVPPGSADTVD